MHTISAGPARGVRFRITLPADKLIWTGTWEAELAEAISNSVRPGDTCLDIGSHRGFFAGVMARAGAGTVHCFEPLAANVTRLEELKSLNPSLPLQLQRVAVGAVDGEAEFSIMAESTMGKLSTSGFQRDARPVGRTLVQSVRLDTLVEQGTVALPDVIKIDVEGAEVDVLTGAHSVLSAARPQVFIEAHSPDLARSGEAFLKRLGYHVLVLETGGDINTAVGREVCHLVARRVS